MSRFSPLHRLRPIIGEHLSKTLPSIGNPNLLHQYRGSSPPEISPTPDSPLYSSFINPFPLSFRALSSFSSSYSSSSPANVVLLGSEEGFNAAFKKSTDEKLPSIFYFTAAWCGPCRLISPVVEQMSKEFPHVTTYKLDIDQEGITRTLSKLQIFSVPTILFFHNGEKASQIVGADVAKLKETVERLYKSLNFASILILAFDLHHTRVKLSITCGWHPSIPFTTFNAIDLKLWLIKGWIDQINHVTA